MAHELKSWVARKMVKIALVAGKQVVNAQHFVPAREQAVDEMRSKKACAP